MMFRSICMLLVLVASPTVLANDFTCRSNGEVRTISVEYEHKGWPVPCRVKYEKPVESITEYPWNAQATPGYCEDRAAFLADKLTNWGWTCEQTRADTEEP